jgi:hypothetical protein
LTEKYNKSIGLNKANKRLAHRYVVNLYEAMILGFYSPLLPLDKIKREVVISIKDTRLEAHFNE